MLHTRAFKWGANIECNVNIHWDITVTFLNLEFLNHISFFFFKFSLGRALSDEKKFKTRIYLGFF